MEEKERLKAFAEKLRQILSGPQGARLLAAVGILGILLLSLPVTGRQRAENAPQTVLQTEAEDYDLQLSRRLEEILGRMKGVGEVHVMVTLSRREEYVYAADLSQSRQAGEGLSSEEKTQRSHVIMERGGEEEALVSTRLLPAVQGVIVVCGGGKDPVVAADVTEAVSAVLEVGPSRIAVLGLE